MRAMLTATDAATLPPCACHRSRLQHLPAISAANPGKRIDFTKHPVPAGTAAPYQGAFGANLAKGRPYNGTLFRLPLRTAEQAAESSISRQAYNPDKVASMLEALRVEAPLVLLFLKSVRRLDALEWRQGEPAPVPLFSCEVGPWQSALAPQRPLCQGVSAVEAAVMGPGPVPLPAAGSKGNGGAAEWQRLMQQRALFLHAAEAPESEEVASTFSLALITR